MSDLMVNWNGCNIVSSPVVAVHVDRGVTEISGGSSGFTSTYDPVETWGTSRIGREGAVVEEPVVT